MATLQQLEEGIRRADQAGDADAVRALGAEYRRMQQQASQPPMQATPAAQPMPQQAAPSPIERFGQSVGSSFTGATQGATLGAYDELASLLGTPIKAAENLFTGRDQIRGAGDIVPFLGRSFSSALEGQQGMIQQAQEQAPVAYGAGDVTGALGLGGLMGAGGLTTLSSVARPTIAGLAGRGALEGALTGGTSGFNVGDQGDTTLPARLRAAGEGALAGGVLGGVTGGIFGGLANRAQTNAVESVDDLKKMAGDLYEAGRKSGLSATPQQSTALANTMEAIAQSENVILPNGKMNPAYTALSGVLDVTDAYKGRPISIGELQTIRGNIRDVVANPEPGVQRIALDMLDEFNKYAYSIYPDLAVADDLYWRAKTGELIEKMAKLADVRSGQYTQSGMENALRAEARAIERQVIRGQIKGLPPELIDQIGKLSRGDDIQNFARWASKFGIQNPITASGGAAAGLATGSVLPALGIWGAAQGAGALARGMANEKYRLASALARSGGNLPAWQFTPALPSLTQGGASILSRALPNF